MNTASAGIREVAVHAGVSVGTVSNVLNRPHLVKEATRQRVLASMEALAFVRNEPARQLRAGRSRTLAYVVLDMTNPFFTDVAAGAEEVAEQAGLTLYLCNSHQNADREREYVDLLIEQRVQGLLLTPVEPEADWLLTVPRRGVPLVLVDRTAGDAPLCSVAVDDLLGGELAITHLIEEGHDRIAFVGGPFGIQQVRDRHAGSLRALTSAGRDTQSLVVIETTALTVAEGRAAGQRLNGLPAARRPTAAFCANDLLALGLLQEMIQHGVEVPNDLAIVGYDDIEFAAAAAVPLTSVRQPRQQLGRTAAELILEEAVGDAEHIHRQVQFEPELVVRASSSRKARSRRRARTARAAAG